MVNRHFYHTKFLAHSFQVAGAVAEAQYFVLQNHQTHFLPLIASFTSFDSLHCLMLALTLSAMPITDLIHERSAWSASKQDPISFINEHILVPLLQPSNLFLID